MVEGGGEDKASVRAPAVFISYASQDAGAAARICSALRQAGVEVWFDQSELRGGDVWDQRIRREIRDCTLFMPVISANTASRHEGYFRLEWDLADQRTHMMARDRAFIVPVCLDATKEAGTDVPESFHRVQWTRLLDGNTPPAFTARIVALLGAPGAAASAAESIHPAAKTGHVAPPALTLAIAKSTLRKNRLAISLMATVTVILAYVAVDRLWLSKHTSAEKPAAAVVPAPIPAIPEKSVAVLPFVDMSERKDQEYFSDGLSEELIDMLTKVPELRVPARTSSFYFKGKQATVPEIAKALGVADVLEGSVRKSGNHLRITAQLVRADNGYHLWSETYDRQLDDIFKVQDEIAGAVVKALKVSLLEGQTPRATPRTNTEAYTLYLQGRSFWQRHSAADNKKAADCLRHALELDRMFAPAWAVLAVVIQDDFVIYSTSSYQKARAEAYPAAEQALKLDPHLSDAHLAMAQILHDLDFDFEGARAEINQALALDPANSGAFRVAADIALTEGRLEEAGQLAQRAVIRDPLAVGNYRALGDAALISGRLSEAEAAWRKALELNAAAEGIHYRLGAMLVLRGKPTAALAEMEQNPDEPWRMAGLPLALDALGRRSEADRALAVAVEKLAVNGPYQIAVIYAHRNDVDRAFAWLDRAYQERDGALALYVKGDPMLSNLRHDPRYKALLRKMNLPE
jgi:TolB-like protein/tetratricopeptide (TPR) repeat protein